MIWLIQKALCDDEFGYESFIAAIDASGDHRIDLDYVFWEATIDLKLTGIFAEEILPFGTRSFICYAKKQKWNVFWDESYSYSSLLCLGEEFINHDMQVASLDDLKVPDTGKIYIREAAGFNIIKGKVINCWAWPDWLDGFKYGTESDMKYYDWHPIDGTTTFACAPVKEITAEYRVWVIDRRVVTSSQYINNGDIRYTNSDENWEVNYYAQGIVDRLPFNMDNYVLDIFRTSKGLKVGEVNCLHCSGWYAIDSRKMVGALLDYARDHQLQ